MFNVQTWVCVSIVSPNSDSQYFAKCQTDLLILKRTVLMMLCLHLANKQQTGTRNQRWKFPVLCSPLWHLNCAPCFLHLGQTSDWWGSDNMGHSHAPAHKPQATKQYLVPQRVMFLSLCYYQNKPQAPDLWQVFSHQCQIITCREVQQCPRDSHLQPQLCGEATRPKYQSFSTRVIHPLFVIFQEILRMHGIAWSSSHMKTVRLHSFYFGGQC